MDSIKSPFAPGKIEDLPVLPGVTLATAAAGIKYTGRTDLMIAVFEKGTSVAGVFTQSRCASAPVEWCRDILAAGDARILVVNSGNANAFTGLQGKNATKRTADAAANAVGCNPEQVYLASTGVIGEPLDPAPFEHLLGNLVNSCQPNIWSSVARAIMTTDTYAKVCSIKFELDGHTFTLNGIAKGAGMIAPDMATMLAFIFTDVPVSSSILQNILSDVVETSFNAITVDSDTSTSDTVLVFATGKTLPVDFKPITEPDDPRIPLLSDALSKLSINLAHQIVKDGEGARKFVEIQITGAADKVAAKKIAMSVANSPLVKTAIAGEDANWGRVVMAIGKAGEEADRDQLSIWFGDHRVAFEGERDPDYSEEAASDYMKNAEIILRADVGVGDGEATVWTCDLTKEYVAINGDYRS